MHRVFVYGTLKRGFPNDVTKIEKLRYIGRFRTIDAYPLVIGGRWFSPYMIAEPGVGHRVIGEVFEVDDRGLERLDRLEGTHVPNGYRRISAAVESIDGGEPFDAWAYVKDRDTIEAIHSEPMEEYGLDTRYITPSNRTSSF